MVHAQRRHSATHASPSSHNSGKVFLHDIIERIHHELACSTGLPVTKYGRVSVDRVEDPGSYVTFESILKEFVMRLLAIRTAAANAECDAEIDDTPGVLIRARSFHLVKGMT